MQMQLHHLVESISLTAIQSSGQPWQGTECHRAQRNLHTLAHMGTVVGLLLLEVQLVVRERWCCRFYIVLAHRAHTS